MGRLSPELKCLAIGLLNVADDDGYFIADAAFVRSEIFPYHEGSLDEIHGMLRELEVSTKWIEVREHATHGNIGRVVNFKGHQKINKPTPSKLLKYWEEGILPESSRNTPVALPESSRNPPVAFTTGKERNKERNKEGKEGEHAPTRDSKPKKKTNRARQLPEDWEPNSGHHEVAEQMGANFDLELAKFRDHAKAEEWTKKDWDATFRNWLRNSPKFSGRSNASHRPPSQKKQVDLDDWAKRKEQEIHDAGGDSKEFEMGFGLLPEEIRGDRDDA